MNKKLKKYALKLFCSSKNYIFLHFALKNIIFKIANANADADLELFYAFLIKYI